MNNNQFFSLSRNNIQFISSIYVWGERSGDLILNEKNKFLHSVRIIEFKLVFFDTIGENSFFLLFQIYDAIIPNFIYLCGGRMNLFQENSIRIKNSEKMIEC